MGITPSRTSLYLPHETFRLCDPDHCWCHSTHRHRTSKYMYVEQGSDGRERYRDPVDMMQEFMGGGNGGGGFGMPWKPAGEWTARDFERLGEVMNEYHARERGRRMGNGGGGGGGGGGFQGMMPWDDLNNHYGFGNGLGGGRRRRTHPSWGEFERMQESVEDKFRRMAEEYQRHMAQQDAMLFGSNEERRREQYQKNMLKTLQEIMPQLSQMIAQQQMMARMGGGGAGGGMMPPMAMPMSGGMPGGMGMGMPQAGMGGMMNPMAAAGMGGFGGMGPPASPMMGGDGMMGGGMNGMGGGGGFGRRARPRRARMPQRSEYEDDYEDFAGGQGGRDFRRDPRRWNDEDDMLGGLRGDGGFSPRGPREPRGGVRPRRPDGSLGGGGMAEQEVFDSMRHQLPLRTARSPVASQGGFNTHPSFTHPPEMSDLPMNMPHEAVSSPASAMRTSSPLPPLFAPSADRLPPGYPHGFPAATMPSATRAYDPTLPPTYTSNPLDDLAPSPMRSGIDPRVRFAAEASLARSRAEEAARKD